MASDIDYSLISAAVYGPDIPPGWTRIATSESMPGWQSDSFYAAAYSDGSEIVIAYRGSTDGTDYVNAIGESLGIPTPQMSDAFGFYNYVEGINNGLAITFTGHSLGGALAAFMAAETGFQATTFDATGSIPATQYLMWYELTAEQQSLTDQNTFNNQVAAYMNSSAIHNYYVSGEIAYKAFSSQVAGVSAASALLPSLTDAKSVHAGSWVGEYIVPLPAGSDQWAANLHNMNLALLAEVDGFYIDAAISANPFFIRQLMNDYDVSHTGLHVSSLLSGLAAQHIASDGAGSILDKLLDDSNIIAGAHIDPNPGLGYSGPNYSGEIDPNGAEGPIAGLQTGLTSLAVGYAALSLSSGIDTGLFNLSNVDGADTTVINFRPPQIQSQAIGEIDTWIDEQIDSMHFAGAPSETIASESWVSIVAPDADGFYAAMGAATGPALAIGDAHNGTFVTGSAETTIFAPGDSTTVVGGDGDLTVWLSGAGHSEVYGGAGDDTLFLSSSAADASLIQFDGGGGTNTLSFEHAAEGVSADLTDSNHYEVTGVTHLVGSAFSDVLMAGQDVSTIEGGAGDDMITFSPSESGGTHIDGGSGFDFVFLSPESPSTGIAISSDGTADVGSDAVNLVSVEALVGSSQSETFHLAIAPQDAWNSSLSYLSGGGGFDKLDLSGVAHAVDLALTAYGGQSASIVEDGVALPSTSNFSEYDLPSAGNFISLVGDPDDYPATVTVNAGGGDDTFQVDMSQGSVSGILLGGGGADTFNITGAVPPDNTGDVPPTVGSGGAFLVCGGSGADTFNFEGNVQVVFIDVPESQLATLSLTDLTNQLPSSVIGGSIVYLANIESGDKILVDGVQLSGQITHEIGVDHETYKFGSDGALSQGTLFEPHFGVGFYYAVSRIDTSEFNSVNSETTSADGNDYQIIDDFDGAGHPAFTVDSATFVGFHNGDAGINFTDDVTDDSSYHELDYQRPLETSNSENWQEAFGGYVKGLGTYDSVIGGTVSLQYPNADGFFDDPILSAWTVLTDTTIEYRVDDNSLAFSSHFEPEVSAREGPFG